jgi:hypothetical protein
LTGIMPMIHPHTAMTLAFVIGWWFVDLLIAQRERSKRWIYYLLPTIAFGLLTTLWQTRGVGEYFFWWKVGWLSGDLDTNWLLFWWINWGVWLLLAIVAYIRSAKENRKALLPIGVLFFLMNLVVTQPYDWDNSKIFTWVQLWFSGLIGVYLEKVWQKKGFLYKTLILFAIFASCVSGFVDSMRLADIQTSMVPMFNNDELLAADWVKENTDKTSIILTSDKHNHFVSTLTGRQIIMGYRGWLWSYGIDYGKRESEIKTMLQGIEGSELLLNKYDVDYVVLSPSEMDNYWQGNLSWYDERFERVAYFGNIYIFRIDK